MWMKKEKKRERELVNKKTCRIDPIRQVFMFGSGLKCGGIDSFHYTWIEEPGVSFYFCNESLISRRTSSSVGPAGSGSFSSSSFFFASLILFSARTMIHNAKAT